MTKMTLTIFGFCQFKNESVYIKMKLYNLKGVIL